MSDVLTPQVMSEPGIHQVEPARAASSKADDLDLGVLSDMVGYQLRRAQLRIFNSFSKAFEHTHVTPAQMGLLIKIRHNAGISQTALAKANGVERSTLGEIIDRFEKRNLVERRKHATDRRTYALHLSTEGEALVNEILPDVLEHEKKLFDDWSREDRDLLLKMLDRLAG